MKYTTSQDGCERASVRVDVRISREQIAEVRAYLRGQGLPSNDTAVREVVRGWTEYMPPSSITECSDPDPEDEGTRRYL